MATNRSLFRWILNSIADRGLSFREGLGQSPIRALSQELVSERGEASGTAIARELATRYAALSNAERLKFFEGLLQPVWLADPEEIFRLAKDYHSKRGAAELTRLVRVSEPKRQELFRRINMGPHGTETVVNMRRDLLALLPDHPQLEPINSDMVHLLASWFNRGFLELRRIDWRTPANVLEKLIRYEAVHKIEGWPDLRRRLQRDRRCFAFFHPALPEEPLIFVQVALTRTIPGAIQPLLNIDAPEMDPKKADTAAFYSISNCLDGLRNISFGAFLLKQVIHELETDQLDLSNFVTLSPIPGFRTWLRKQGLDGSEELNPAGMNKTQRFKLTQMCARYLTAQSSSGRAADPVTHFHLSNGAAIERINWMGDTSRKGMQQSYGLMVNYSYRPPRIERNHEQYVKQGRLALSKEVAELLEEPKPAPKSSKSQPVSQVREIEARSQGAPTAP
jgi:malonyl-CoA decarboxylase